MLYIFRGNFKIWGVYSKQSSSIFTLLQSKRQPEKIGRRNVLEILKDSLQDHPEITSQGHFQESVRYKLIIDSSDDESAIRLLFAHGILEKENTRMYVCSEFLDESHMHVSPGYVWLIFSYQCYDCFTSSILDQHHCWYQAFCRKRSHCINVSNGSDS